MPCMRRQTFSMLAGFFETRHVSLRYVHGVQLLDGCITNEREPRRGGQKCAVLSLISQNFDLSAT